MKRIIYFLCIRSFSIAIVGIIFISTSFLQSQNCVVPDNGTGTATLPPIGCQYQSVDPFMIIDGLPPGTTIELHGIYSNFICCAGSCPCSLPIPPGECEMPGGSLGGHGHCFLGSMVFDVIGTGELEGFNRTLYVEIFSEIHTGPRTPGDPVQTFPADYYRFEGELLGDPDFCTLHIIGGSDFGLPGPGETTLTQLPSGDFAVDSFFDITYQIEFEGCPGSPLEGYAGTTTSTTRFEIPSVGNDFIDPGPDFWIVPESPVSSVHPGGPGGEIDPIPADFFGPGSDPFDGVIYLKGESLESTEFPNPDAIIERTSQANLPEPYPASDQVQTEIVELSLVSTAPITVTFDGGQDPELWDVELELSTYPQPTGNMDITKNDANGGEFYYSPLYVYPRLIFTQTSPPNNTEVLDLGGTSLLDYTNSTAYPWEHSPIGNDFNPSGTTPMELISASGDCELYLIPYLLRQDDFWVEVDPDGNVIAGGGSGYNDGEWYYYPNTNWWNIWFYDHPYDPDREKGINISFTISGSGNAEVVINWSTGYWPGQGSPPLPEDVIDPAYEDSCIVRSVPIFSGPVTGSTVVNQYFEIPVYNPEWISIDIRGMNFDITNGIIEHICLQPEGGGELDFGDAPDPTYPTLLANDGARHILDGVTYLGAQIDAEPDGLQSSDALGDDNNNLDDEDGVIFTCPLIPGEQGAILVTTSATGYLNAWLDFGIDGSWIEAGDQIFTDELLIAGLIAGLNPLNFMVPTTAVPGVTFARFRFDTGGGLGVTGLANDGEVEDYRVVIEENLHDGLKMHYHQWPDTTMFGVDVCTMEWRMLADDFFCVESGPINSIHIWGSWKYDEMIPDNAIFDLAIWSDNPEGPSGWSEPDSVLWDGTFLPGEYLEQPYYYVADGEWWYDVYEYPPLIFPGDWTVWEYHFTIPDAEAFFQEENTVYWLSVRTWTLEPYFEFGWKSSVNHWNDDAVWLDEPTRQFWQELIYPVGHPFNPISMDMAFYIDCHPQDPQNITISEDGTNVTIQWDPSWCADYYNVYSSTDPYAVFPSGWTYEATVWAPNTTWSEALNSKKFYRVTAEN